MRCQPRLTPSNLAPPLNFHNLDYSNLFILSQNRRFEDIDFNLSRGYTFNSQYVYFSALHYD